MTRISTWIRQAARIVLGSACAVFAAAAPPQDPAPDATSPERVEAITVIGSRARSVESVDDLSVPVTCTARPRSSASAKSIWRRR